MLKFESLIEHFIEHLSINADEMVPLKVVHLLSDYPNLESTILSYIEDLQQAEIEDYEEGREEEEYIELEYEEGVEPDYEEGLEPEFEEGFEEETEYIEPD